ncbi:hypothetical protein C1T17_18445 [Sphingobium sp. SCG-1]|uniref:ABC transporter ATP-binding protein/permease n=1 Tax=Sphingobium sp. SCG-1 TaxID=2072936 RepID=UPI000CD6AACA|nr:ATP-binding cassette domain-containing protein [Sphingobium sp. SCG-1]AUW59760.1 hypothetical protein C1T17_18445 [Sphingobium sp. SCG-1]
MAIIQPLTANSRDYRLNGLLLSRIWRLIRPYWGRLEAWRSWLLLVLLLSSVMIGAAISALQTYQLKTLTDQLIARSEHGFAIALFAYIAFLLFNNLMPVVMSVADNWLLVDWRRWMTTHLVDRYLEHRTYYDIALKDDLDNPDQRLQESITPFVTTVAQFPRTFLFQSGTVISAVGILMSIDSTLLWWAFTAGVLQVLLNALITIPTIKLAFQWTVAEADLRYGLTHVRENAEAIAFYHGEPAERVHILKRLMTASRTQLWLNFYKDVAIPGVLALLSAAWIYLPYWFLAPHVVAGTMTYGTIAQAAGAVSLLQSSLLILSRFLPLLAEAAPPAVRLAQIQERLETLRAVRSTPTSRRLTIDRTSETVRLDNVSLETPGGEQQLVKALSLCVDGDTNLAIVGQTGVGKSSLLRAMAGLWTRGHGQLEMPPPEHCLFLPQRPYMILADLRSQLLYPHDPEVTDERLYEVLEAVNLRHVIDKHGGLSAVRDWGRVLSLGEQQRIAFARVLVSKPYFVFLDEATSAVDFATETRLYRLLAGTGASYISIGHRLSILDHHTHVLTLKVGGEWSIERHDPIDGLTAPQADHPTPLVGSERAT